MIISSFFVVLFYLLISLLFTFPLSASLHHQHLLVNNSPVQCQQQQLHPKRELTQPLAVPTAQSPLLQSRRRVVTAEGDSGDGNHQTTLSGTSPSPPTKDNNCDDDAHHQDFVNDRVKGQQIFLFVCMLTLLTNSYFPSVTLDCKPNLMRLHLNFTEPFRGVVSVGRSSWDELSGGETAATAKEAHRCSIRGQGSRRYRLDLDHRSCRTTFDVRMCSMLKLISLPKFAKIFFPLEQTRPVQ